MRIIPHYFALFVVCGLAVSPPTNLFFASFSRISCRSPTFSSHKLGDSQQLGASGKDSGGHGGESIGAVGLDADGGTASSARFGRNPRPPAFSPTHAPRRYITDRPIRFCRTCQAASSFPRRRSQARSAAFAAGGAVCLPDADARLPAGALVVVPVHTFPRHRPTSLRHASEAGQA